jgi:hypothetical protein
MSEAIDLYRNTARIRVADLLLLSSAAQVLADMETDEERKAALVQAITSARRAIEEQGISLEPSA